MGHAPGGTVKNVTYSTSGKSGEFVNARLSSMHHRPETRLGLAEVLIAGFIVAVLAGFAFAIVH
jgi:hypothetical protein